MNKTGKYRLLLKKAARDLMISSLCRCNKALSVDGKDQIVKGLPKTLEECYVFLFFVMNLLLL